MHASSRRRIRTLVRVALILLAPATASPLWPQAGAATAAAQPASGAQSPSDTLKVPRFSVISIKRNLTAQGWRDGNTADGYSASNVTVNWILPEAYGIRESYRIFGAPDWAGTYHYDIQAKVDDADISALGKLDWKLRYAMVRQILEDRFKIKVHRENRTQPIYSLVVVRKDRLPPAADPNTRFPNGLFSRSRAGQLTVLNLTMAGFADAMSGRLGRVVVDDTGITGRYDFKLDWNPNEADTTETDSTAPSIFTAVQEQLGLKLVPSTGPVECLVIDHIEPPSEN